MADDLTLITGGGSGIGAAVAARLATRDVRIVLVDRSEAGLAKTRSALEAGGASVTTLVADVTSDEQLAAAATQVASLGQLRTVVACAGIEAYGDVTSTSVEDWRRTIDVNLTGMFLTARHTMPLLLEAGSGSFTAIASDAGVFGAQAYAAYCASKHGVIGLIRCMALDHGPHGVRSNVVCPGFVETPMAERIFAETSEEEKAFFQSTVPLGRFADPAEVAEVVAHLSSPAASYTNGLVYNIDGGSTSGYFQPGD